MAEQRFCKPQVGGSIPLASSKPTFGWPGGSSSVCRINATKCTLPVLPLALNLPGSGTRTMPRRARRSPHSCSSEHKDGARWHVAGSILLNRYQAAEELLFILARENFDGPHVWQNRRRLPQDAQTGHPARPQQVKSRGGTYRPSYRLFAPRWILANGKARQ